MTRKLIPLKSFVPVIFYILLGVGLLLCALDLAAIFGGTTGKSGYALGIGGILIVVALEYKREAAVREPCI